MKSKADRDRATQQLKESLRDTDRMRADAQRDMEFARAQFSERRRYDRRIATRERVGAPERRIAERRH